MFNNFDRMFKGDIFNDNSTIGKYIKDGTRGRNGDGDGVVWRGQDKKMYYKDQFGTFNHPNRFVTYKEIEDPNPNNNENSEVSKSAKGNQGGAYGNTTSNNSDTTERDLTVELLNNSKRSLEERLGLINKHKRGVMNQISDAHNKGLNRLNQQQSSALSRYKMRRNDTKRDFQNSVQDIDAQAYNNYSALQGLLGRSGAGSSSASKELVPYAVSQSASKSRGEISNTYGKNLRDLREAENETNISYNNNLQDLKEQKRNKVASAKSDFLNQRNSLNNQIAEIEAQKVQANNGSWQQAKTNMSKYTNAASKAQKALAGLLDEYRNPVKVQDIVVRDPKVENYSADMKGVKVDDPNGNGYDTDTSLEYLARLKEERERKKQQ